MAGAGLTVGPRPQSPVFGARWVHGLPRQIIGAGRACTTPTRPVLQHWTLQAASRCRPVRRLAGISQLVSQTRRALCAR